MRARLTALLGLGIFGLAGCTSWPFQNNVQNIGFLRGCWVAKDEAGVNFRLRITSDGEFLAGDLYGYSTGRPELAAHMIFARDGSRAVVEMDGATWDYVADPEADNVEGEGGRQANFLPSKPQVFGLIQAYRKDDRLMLAVLAARGGPLFEGERDTCKNHPPPRQRNTQITGAVTPAP